eukprot:3884478-Rhodomonas_salina.1
MRTTRSENAGTRLEAKERAELPEASSCPSALKRTVVITSACCGVGKAWEEAKWDGVGVKGTRNYRGCERMSQGRTILSELPQMERAPCPTKMHSCHQNREETKRMQLAGDGDLPKGTKICGFDG